MPSRHFIPRVLPALWYVRWCEYTHKNLVPTSNHSAMIKLTQSNVPTVGVWFIVPDDLRPTSVTSDHLSLDSHHLFMVKQGWMIEIVGLDTMGRLDIEDLDANEPMVFSPM